MSDTSRAVFLSYASQDAEAARHICEALRRGGMEVWLDQEGGLGGGDVWDRKIREQIAACALFVPIISANTQARHEGYFRLEWKLAEDRSHLIAKGKPFIVPVCVDATSERGALVPDAFLAVQWSRLPGGVTPALFVERVRKLLSGEVAGAISTPAVRPAHQTQDQVVPSAPAVLPSRPDVPLERVAPSRRGGERLWQTAAVVSIAIAVAIGFLHFSETPPPQKTFRYTLSGPEDSTALPSFAISPDGRYVAMAAVVKGKRQLWLRALDALETKLIPSTDEAELPFWSPDSRTIGFFAQGKLKKVAAGGGPVQTLCDVFQPRGGSWNRDDVIIFAGIEGPLGRVASLGGVSASVTNTRISPRWPVFLPDGRRFLYGSPAGTGQEQGGIFVGSLDGKEDRRILPDVSRIFFASGDRWSHVLFSRGNTLMALPFDVASAQATGEAFPVAENVANPATVVGASVSANGVLLFAPGTGNLSDQINQISWFDRTGKLLDSVGAPGPGFSPRDFPG